MNRYDSPKRACRSREQVDDLRLDRHVERRDRLVADDEPRLDRERARDADPLALAAGELVRIAARVLGREADEPEDLGDALALPALREPVQRERLARASGRRSSAD